MKKLLIALAFLPLSACSAGAQCSGIFSPFYICGNPTASPAPPGPNPSLTFSNAIMVPSTTTSGDIVTWGNATGGRLGDQTTITTTQTISGATFGNPTLTGTNTISGTNTFTGTNIITGTASFSSTVSFTGPVTMTGTTSILSLTFIQPGSSASQSTVTQKLQRLINGKPTVVDAVVDFGADPTGTNDSTTAIQNAINALPTTGGDVYLCGGFKISKTLTMGNGSATTSSSTWGMHLRGCGGPNWAAFPIGAATGATYLLWTGAASPMVQVLGPLQGWGVHNIQFDGGNTANQGLDILGGQFGDSGNLTFVNVGGAPTPQSIVLNTWNGTSGINNASTIHNTFTNIGIQVPSTSGATGLWISANPSQTNDSDYNTFSNMSFVLPNTTNSIFGIYMGYNDANAFYNVVFHGGGNITHVIPITFDYTAINNTFPSNNSFYNIDTGPYTTAWQNLGVPSPLTPPGAPNFLFGIPMSNGASPPTIAGLAIATPYVNRTLPISFAFLPTCNAGAEGAVASVQDATTSAYNATLTGGGSIHTMGYCTGTTWVTH